MKRISTGLVLIVGFIVTAHAAPKLWVSEVLQIQEIDTATNQVVATFVFDNLPNNTALGPAWQTPGGGTLYAALDNGREIYEIDPATGDNTGSLALAAPNYGFFSPSWDGKKLYTGLVGDSGGGDTASMQAFRLSDGTLLKEIDAGEEWFVTAVAPSDARVYAGSRDINHTYVLGPDGDQLAQWTISDNALCDPATVLLSADGKRAYVACRAGSPNFEVLNAESGALIQSVDAGLTDVVWATPAPDGDIWVFGLDNGGTLYVFDGQTYALKQTQLLDLNFFNYTGMAFSPDGTRFYVTDASGGSPRVGVYDTTTLQRVATINTVLPPFIGFHSLTRGGFYARQQSAGLAKNEQLSGTLDLKNSTGCTPTYSVVEQPRHGTLVLDSATGDFTFTPDSNYIGSDVFTWRATAPGSCTAADNPTLPMSNVAAVSISLDDASAPGSVSVATGATREVTVKAKGVGPWTAAATSSNGSVVSVSKASCPATLGNAACSIVLKGVSGGAADVSVTLTDAYGGTQSRTLAVTASQSSGGGGALGVPLLAALALLALSAALDRRRREETTGL